jgi:hypothetical protein
MPNYRLRSNDGAVIEFCEHQLELLEYAKSALTDSVTNEWASPVENELPVPGLSKKMLEYVSQWTTLALRVPESKRCLHRSPIVVTPSMFMKHGVTQTGQKFTDQRPFITEDTEWTEKSTGIASELLAWMNKCRAQLSLDEYFELLFAAYFVGANGMIDLVAGRLAWEMVTGREEVYAHAIPVYRYMNTNPHELPTSAKLRIFSKWLDTDEPTSPALTPIKLFFREMRKNFSKSGLLRNIVMNYQIHGGLPVPRETWGDAEWENFTEQARAFYLTLPEETK